MRLLIISLAIILSTRISAVPAQCSDSESINKVRIVGLLEIHPTPDCNKNEELRTYGLSLALAAEYIIDLVNNGDSDIAVPGVQYEFQLEDVCRNRSLATRKAAVNIPETLWTEKNVCFSQSEIGDGQQSLLLGFVGPAFSSNAKYVAEFLNNTDIPVITPSATLAEFSDKTRYHSLLRTATSDEKQIKAMIDVALKLEWSFVLLIHTDDNYGRQGAEAIKTYGEMKGICFSDVIEVKLDPVNSLAHHEDIAKKIKMSQAKGIIYYGFEQQAIAIIENYIYITKDSPTQRKVILASEGVGTSSGVLDKMETDDGRLGLITLSLYNKPNNLESYIRQRLDGTKSGTPETTMLIEQFVKECNSNIRCTNDTILKASDATQQTINAVVALMFAFVETHKEICLGIPGVCPKLSKSHAFYPAMRESLFSTSIDVNMIGENVTIIFDDTGELDGDTTEPAFALNVAMKLSNSWLYNTVGTYYHNETWMFANEEFLTPSYGSRCVENCDICRKKRTPYIYRPSETSRYIIAGTGIINENWDQHTCDQKVKPHGFVMMEAFYYTTEIIKNVTGIQFATLFIDTCRAKLGTLTIMNQIFREEDIAYLIDPTGKEWTVRPTDFIVFLTGSSSGVSLALQTYLDLYNIPQISYKSTSVWLSDSLRYPLFLRNVPSDEEQARLMIEVVEQNKWNNIGLICSNSVYGQTGGDLVKKYATKANICISFLRTVRSSSDAIGEMVHDIRNAANDNRLPKVIIIFAEDEIIKELLQKIQRVDPEWKERGNILIGSETWSTLPQVIEGVEEFVYGSLTFSFSDSIYSWTINGINYFQQYLDSQKPENNADNYLFIQFWQQYFDCYLIQDSLPANEKKCEESLSLAYTSSVSQRMDYEDIPSKHLVMAGLSVAYAILEAANIKKHCKSTGTGFNCSVLFDTASGRTDFVQYIQQTKIPQQANSDFKTYAPFLQSGDGKANYHVYNIVKNQDGTASYQLLYEITDGKIVQSETPKFYIDGVLVDTVNSACKTACDCVNYEGEDPPTLYLDPVMTSNGPLDSAMLNTPWQISIAVLLLLLLSFAVHIIFLKKKLAKMENKFGSSEVVTGRHQLHMNAEIVDSCQSIETGYSDVENSGGNTNQQNVTYTVDNLHDQQPDAQNCSVVPLEVVHHPLNNHQSNPNIHQCSAVLNHVHSRESRRNIELSDGNRGLTICHDNLHVENNSLSLPKMFTIKPISHDIN